MPTKLETKGISKVGNVSVGIMQKTSSVPASYPKKQVGISVSTGKKTKHQIAKEKQQAQVKLLEDKIDELNEQLRIKNKMEEAMSHRQSSSLTVSDGTKHGIKEVVIEKFRNQVGFNGTIVDFKLFLKTLIGEI